MDAASYEVIPGVLFGRAGPQLQPWNLVELSRAGLKAIVSLVNENAGIGCAELGIAHYQLNFSSEIREVTARSRNRIMRIVSSFFEAAHPHVDRGEPVIVHCHRGRDRTAIIIALYLIQFEDLKLRQALDRVQGVKADAFSGQNALVLTKQLAKLLRNY